MVLEEALAVLEEVKEALKRFQASLRRCQRWRFVKSFRDFPKPLSVCLARPNQGEIDTSGSFSILFDLLSLFTN